MGTSKLEEYTFTVPSGSAGPGVPWTGIYNRLHDEGLLNAELDAELVKRMKAEEEDVDPIKLRGGSHDDLDVYSVTVRESITMDEIKGGKEAKGDGTLEVLRTTERTLIAWNRNPYPPGTAAHETWPHAEVKVDKLTFRLENQRNRPTRLIQDTYLTVNKVSEEERAAFRAGIGSSGT